MDVKNSESEPVREIYGGVKVLRERIHRERRKPRDFFMGTVKQTNAWIKQIADVLPHPDPGKGYLALRAVLQTLRDRLDPAQVAHLGAQLPLLIRGIYYEGWDPASKPIKYNKEEFFQAVGAYFSEDEEDFDCITRVVFSVLQQNISKGEIQKIKNHLPKDFNDLWAVEPEQRN